MKRHLTMLALAAVAAVLALGAGCNRETPPAAEAAYHCPMHPTIVSDKAGDCPICGMRLVPMKAKPADPAAATPGPKGLAPVTIDGAARQRMGLTLGTVEARALTRAVRTSARIVADETRLYHVSLKVEGWVEHFHDIFTGQLVRKGDPLLRIYSPELVSAQQEYLAAVRAVRALGESADAAVRDQAQGLRDAARHRLELWDIRDEQIARLERTDAVETNLTLYAPYTGWVLERSIAAGHKLMPGESLLVLADLTHLWAEADIYQSDLPHVQVGMPVEITIPDWGGKVFRGVVTFTSPTVDAATRTGRARMDIENPDLELKPGMYADARLTVALGDGLAIPGSAVMRTGEHTYAFREAADGRLIPVAITLGARAGDHYQLLAGLDAGDRVVTSANFLVDSESSLQAALQAMTAGGGARTAEDGR